MIEIRRIHCRLAHAEESVTVERDVVARRSIQIVVLGGQLGVKERSGNSQKKVRNYARKPNIRAWQSILKKAFTGLCKPSGLRSKEGRSIMAFSSPFLREQRSICFPRPGRFRSKEKTAPKGNERNSCFSQLPLVVLRRA